MVLYTLLGKSVVENFLKHDYFLKLCFYLMMKSNSTFRRGQLGNGELCQSEKPIPVESLQGIAISSIVCGGWHSIGEYYYPHSMLKLEELIMQPIVSRRDIWPV